MKLSNAEKLIITMLADLHLHLDVESDVDASLVKDAITSGNAWAIEQEHLGLFDAEEADRTVLDEVHSALGMWGRIEEAYDRLSSADKDKVAEGADPFGTNPRWPGFDGNHEGAHMSAARMLIERLDRYPHFKGRGSLNSHHNTLDTTARMRPTFDRIIQGSDWGRVLTADDLIEILNEQVHPENR